MLIRFSPMRTTVSVLPTARIQPVIGRRGCAPAYPEQRAESIKRVKAAVKPERELIEVGLQVLRADAVMATAQPAFQVAENQVDDWQKFLGDSRVVGLDNGQMLVSKFGERGITRRAIGENHR